MLSKETVVAFYWGFWTGGAISWGFLAQEWARSGETNAKLFVLGEAFIVMGFLVRSGRQNLSS